MKTFGSFRLDTARRRLWRDDEIVPLTPKAFETLVVLVARAGQVVEKDEILKAVWPDTFVEDATLAQNISTLRKALGDTSDTPSYVATIPRRGYRFIAPMFEVAEVESAADTPAPAAPEARSRMRYVAAATGAIALLTGFAWRAMRPPIVPQSSIAFDISAPDGNRFSASGGFLAISPDGRHVAFVASEQDGIDRLWLRALDERRARVVAGTEGAFQPFWSADSRALAFFADGKLKKVPIVSGSVQTICDTPAGSIPLAGTWSASGDILFSNARRGIVRVPANGGVAAPLVSKEAADDAVAWPQFLPDGRRFLYLLDSARSDRAGIYAGTLDSTQHVRIAAARSSAMYSPTGHLLYVKGNTLVAQRFDPSTLRVSGAPAPIADQIAFNAATARATFSVSQTGVLVYRATAESELTWFDRDGRPLGRIGTPATYVGFAVSPAGSHVAAVRLDRQTGLAHIWILDAAGGERRLTVDPAWEAHPVWSRDGARVAFNSNRNGRWEIFEKTVDGGKPERRLISSTASVSPEDWSPDGRMLYQRSDLKAIGDFWLSAPGDGAGPERLPYLETDEGAGRISPDGRWIAYRGYESGWFIYVRPSQPSGNRWQVSGIASQWSEPRWRADGRELFYLAPDLSLMTVPVAAGSTFQAGPPRLLFQTHASPPSGAAGRAYDVMPDGSKFLVKVAAARAPITVVVGWPALTQSSLVP